MDSAKAATASDGAGKSATDLRNSRLWADALQMPAVLDDLLSARAEFGGALELLSKARRIVATGNGAAYYAAMALAHAALDAPASGIEVIAVPAGLISTGHLTWKHGDVPLVFSSSGELRDIVSALPAGLPTPWVLVTSMAGSTLQSQATASVVVPVRSQEAVTHTQAYIGNVMAGLMLWQGLAQRPLRAGFETLVDVVARSLDDAPSWAEAVVGRLAAYPTAAIAFGSGCASVAALEAALLLKEVAGIPAEGLETREGATSGMYALRSGHLVLAHLTPGDALAAEAAEVCRRANADVAHLATSANLPHTTSPLTAFAAALALAGTLGLRAGRDIDSPPWAAAYYATARSHPKGQQP